jgi:hypothetical protein
MLRPTTLFLSLQPPARVHLGFSRWNVDGEVRIQGIPVEGNDTPWCTFPDLLIDRDGQVFLGLTFQITDPEYWKPMQQIAQRLDARVVRYNDLSTADSQQMYPGEAGKAHRFEIAWAPARRLGAEAASLCCGQWFWWYAMQGSWGISPPIIALGITDVDAILDAHNLQFPGKLGLPALEVELPSPAP